MELPTENETQYHTLFNIHAKLSRFELFRAQLFAERQKHDTEGFCNKNREP